MVFAFWRFLAQVAYPAPENMIDIFQNFVKFHRIFHGNFKSFIMFNALVKPRSKIAEKYMRINSLKISG